MFDFLVHVRHGGAGFRPGASLVLISVAVAVLALGCSSGGDDENGEPDAADMLDGGGSADAATDADTDAGAEEMDAGPREDSGGHPDDAEVPPDDAADDGSTPPPEGPCARWERDVDGDGEVDTAIAYFYDADDRLVIEEHDTGSAPDLFDGADGTADYRQTTTYDEDGNVASLADDWDADGNDDLITRYDADGRKTEELFDVADDGSMLDRTTYAYREDGELASKERDVDDDGTPDSATTYVYDDDGLLLRIDEDADLSDEPADKVTSYEYDDQGHRTQEEVYEGDVPVSRVAFSYDEDGNLIRREEDDGIDEVLDAVEQWTFDSGVLASHELDEDGDGLRDERQTFDADGRVLTDESYHDGVLDVTTAFEYDADGDVLVERVTNGEAALLSEKRYEYEDRRATLLTVDADGDGTDDLATRWTYDEDGRLVSVEERRGTDPEAPFVVTEGYEYDAEGRLLEITFDSDADGTPDGFERRSYEC